MKKAFIILIVVLAFAIPLSTFAATSDSSAAQAIRGFCGIDTSKLNDQQKADMSDQFKKMMDLRKETIDKMASNGTITKDQGAALIKRIDDMVKYRQENGFAGGCGMGKDFSGGRGMGRGCGGNGCNFYNAPTK